ncbi:hypothetical protein HMPREF9413_1504 [Paenibacillus sp. HGF7]|nr:hypothetical protein HMPREF9413_1504 [Paenibacillus sp. HGF7]
MVVGTNDTQAIIKDSGHWTNYMNRMRGYDHETSVWGGNHYIQGRFRNWKKH